MFICNWPSNFFLLPATRNIYGYLNICDAYVLLLDARARFFQDLFECVSFALSVVFCSKILCRNCIPSVEDCFEDHTFDCVSDEYIIDEFKVQNTDINEENKHEIIMRRRDCYRRRRRNLWRRGEHWNNSLAEICWGAITRNKTSVLNSKHREQNLKRTQRKQMQSVREEKTTQVCHKLQ